jgi:subtilase family serine protease
MPYVNYLVSQQKAPFYIDCGNPGGGTTLTSSSVSNVEFTVTDAPTTQNQEYTGLQIANSINETYASAFVVLGLVYNVGNQTANNIKVVGTYYNTAGTVVAVGFEKLSDALIPYNGTAFTVSEFDATSSLVAQISSYSLLIQTSTLQNNSISSSSPSSSGSSELTYIIIAIVAIVVVAAVALMFLRKRRNLPPPPPILPPPPPS